MYADSGVDLESKHQRGQQGQAVAFIRAGRGVVKHQAVGTVGTQFHFVPGAGVTGAASDPYSQFTLGKAQQALQTAARDVSLTKAAPGAAAPTVDTNTLIGSQIAGFGGTSQPAAQQAVALAEQAAVAPFEKGGGYSETAKGVTGLGAART